ncbi:hypothetical protein PanWU01x14_050020 [Parasponia andersonii]|uniref:Uncharacterized protein n=1 Tax=Parasponia andersonii TaxID=3476 RepID=A0A2P5DMS8_PARAD|nr:hypothetical protein PanWU01x14_050020 [Parasponia andersonii]
MFDCGKKISISDFALCRIFLLQSYSSSTLIKNFRMESKFSGRWSKIDQNNLERWQNKSRGTTKVRIRIDNSGRNSLEFVRGECILEFVKEYSIQVILYM